MASPAARPLPQKSGFLFPREHGAWSMLAQPFLCSLILARAWHWSVLPAAVAVVGVFVLREPLVVLGRQRWVWRDRRPESAAAVDSVVWTLAVLAACGIALTSRWPWSWLAGFGVAAALLTALAVWMTVRNRQRAVWLQILSAAGLTASCLAASLAATGTLPGWIGWLWGVQAAHAAAGVLTVHARLEARIAARTGRPPAAGPLRSAMLMQAVLVAAAVACVFVHPHWLAVPLLVSAAVHLRALGSLGDPRSLQVPLRTVGFRAMALSIAVSLLTILALW